MHDVFAAAAAGTVAYVGSGPAETSAPAVADWRRFLDLVEDVGGSTKAAGLIETWAVPASSDRSSQPGRPLANAMTPWWRRDRAGCQASSSASR